MGREKWIDPPETKKRSGEKEEEKRRKGEKEKEKEERAERSFSMLQRLKSRMRSRTSEKRMTGQAS